MPRHVRLALLGPILAVGCQGVQDPPAATFYPLLAGRSIETAQTIEFLGSRDGQPYRLEPGPLGSLRLVQPIRDTAAVDAVSRLARACAEASLEVPTEGTAGPDPNGLDHPIAFLEATYADGTVRVELGGPAKGRPDQIVARVGNRVGFVPASLLRILQPEQAMLRERALFEQRDADTVRIEWGTSAGPQACVARRAGTLWRFDGPLPAQPIAAGDLAAAVLGLRADSYHHGPLPGDQDPRVRITTNGPQGSEELTLQRSDKRWLGIQAHRDLPVFVTLPPALGTLF